MDITYRSDAELSVEAAIKLYRASTLGARRPVDRPDIFEGMLKHANLTVTAWHGDKLVGIARSLTDFTYVAYLADLAVDEAYQRQGIGKRLIAETKAQLGKECMIVLLAAPQANEYYAKLGFESNPRGWVLAGSACTNQDLAGQWKAENAQAIRTYNSVIGENGVFGDALRKF